MEAHFCQQKRKIDVKSGMITKNIEVYHYLDPRQIYFPCVPF